MGGILLGAACVIEPWFLLWCPALAVLVLVRGHIYASAGHLGLSLLQTVVLPSVGAAIAFVAAGAVGGPACLRGAWHEELVLGRVLAVAPAEPALHNPALWFAGLGAVAFLALAGLLRTLMHFRLARLPGRLQIRLPEPVPAVQARSTWILALVLLAPHPALLWPLLAIALVAGLLELGADAAGFGTALTVAAVAFAIFYAVQAWGVLSGTASLPEAERLATALPWTSLADC